MTEKPKGPVVGWLVAGAIGFAAGKLGGSAAAPPPPPPPVVIDPEPPVAAPAPTSPPPTQVPVPTETNRPKSLPVPRRQPVPDTYVYYANCSQARAAGADPVYDGDPGYASHLDRDGDGVGCE